MNKQRLQHADRIRIGRESLEKPISLIAVEHGVSARRIYQILKYPEVQAAMADWKKKLVRQEGDTYLQNVKHGG